MDCIEAITNIVASAYGKKVIFKGAKAIRYFSVGTLKKINYFPYERSSNQNLEAGG